MTDKTRRLTIERSTSTAHRLSHYDGVCGNLHGHNMEWEAEVEVKMTGADHSMPLDLKDVSDQIDAVDHALVVNKDDPLLQLVLDNHPALDGESVDDWDGDENGFVGSWDLPTIGQTFVFARDPTCEVMSKWMAGEIYRLDEAVQHVALQVNETKKYGIGTEYSASDAVSVESQTLTECLGGNE